MPREALPDDMRRKPLNITLSPEALELLDRLARKRKLTKSQLLEELVRVESTRNK